MSSSSNSGSESHHARRESTCRIEITVATALHHSSQRWAAFVRNHAKAIIAADFLTVVTARFQFLYVLVVMEVGTRKIVHVNVTTRPTAEWTLQQFREHASRSISLASARSNRRPPYQCPATAFLFCGLQVERLRVQRNSITAGSDFRGLLRTGGFRRAPGGRLKAA